MQQRNNQGIPSLERPELSMQELRRGHYHALKEACQMLVPVADPRSLHKWIDELGITIYKSPVQGNTSLISHKDLVDIASLVGRTLREEGYLPSRRTGVQLSPQLAELKAHYERELDTLMRRIEALKAEHLQEIAQLKAQHAQEVETLQRKLQQLQAPVAVSSTATPTATSLTEDEKKKMPPLYSPHGKMKVHAIPADLPSGTVTMRTFAETHGTTRDIMTAAIARGDLEAVTRRYGDERTQSFFTPQQQDAAVAYLEGKYLPVTRCPYCPHADHTAT